MTETESERKQEFDIFRQLYRRAETLYMNNKIDEALSTFLELSHWTEFLMRKYGGFKEQEFYQISLLRIGFCLMDLKRDDEALAYFKDAYIIEKKLVAEQGSVINKVDFSDTANMIGDILMLQEKYDEATKYYKISMRMLKDLNSVVQDRGIDKKYKETKNDYENALRDSNAKNQLKIDTFTSAKSDKKSENKDYSSL